MKFFSVTKEEAEDVLGYPGYRRLSARSHKVGSATPVLGPDARSQGSPLPGSPPAAACTARACAASEMLRGLDKV